MGFTAVKILVNNQSTQTFKPPKCNLSLATGGHFNNEDGNEIIVGRLDYINEFELNDGASEASGFLTYEFGEQGHKLVTWLWMKPEAFVVEFKAGIFPKETKISREMLEQLAPVEANPAALNFESEFLWESEDKKEVLGINAKVRVNFIEADRDRNEYYEYGSPDVGIFIYDPYFKKAQEVEVPGTYPFKIAAGWNQSYGEPVHENMALASLIAAGLLDNNTTYSDVVGRWSLNVGQPDVWEYMRGLIWNDDPVCSLFNDDLLNNGNFGAGVEFTALFYQAKLNISTDTIIKRSHFGDLQFLHAMGCRPGESPQESKRKIMIWLEIMYKLAAGNQGVGPEDRLDSTPLKEFFNDSTLPRGSNSLRDLLLGNTRSYVKVMIERRALGSCFHTIQDSYAVGHCQRRLLNPDDRDRTIYKPSLLERIGYFVLATAGPMDDERVRFQPGKPGRFAEIQNFHTYNGQDGDKHDAYDLSGGSAFLFKPSDVTSFNHVVGAQDAIDQCTKLAYFFKEGKRWEDGVQSFLADNVFKLADGATDSNLKVDESIR